MKTRADMVDRYRHLNRELAKAGNESDARALTSERDQVQAEIDALAKPREILETLSVDHLRVLRGEGANGFCAASDRVVALGLMNDADGELTDSGREVLRLAKMFGDAAVSS